MALPGPKVVIPPQTRQGLRNGNQKESTITLEVVWMQSVSGGITATCDFDGANPFGIQKVDDKYRCDGNQQCLCALAIIYGWQTLLLVLFSVYAFLRFRDPDR